MKKVLGSVGAAAVLLVALAGCSATPAAPADPAPTTTATTTPVAASSSTPSAAPSPAAAAACAATGSGIPAGARTRTTVDVDGDGKPDTEWLSKDGRTFGITTASGATSTVRTQYTSGAGPEAMTTKLPGTSTIVSWVGDDRLIAVYRYEHCALRPIVDTEGVQYRFDLTGTHGYGAGCEDLTGAGKDTLVGYQLDKPYGGLEDHEPVTVTTTAVDLTGTTATAGRTSTATTELPGGKATLTRATTVSCGSTTITRDGVHL